MLDQLESWGAELSRRLAVISTAALLLVALLVCLEIIARTVFRFSLVGVSDVTGLVVAVGIAAAFPVVTMQRGHLVIELLHNHMGDEAALFVRFLGGWVMFSALALLTWRIGVRAVEFGQQNAATQVINLPESPFLWVITFFMGLATALQLFPIIRDACEMRSIWRAIVCGQVKTIIYIFLAILVFSFILLGIIDRGDTLTWLFPTTPIMLSIVIFAAVWLSGMLMLPLGSAMLLAGLAGISIMLGSSPGLSLIATRSIEFLASDILLIIPLFLLMGTFAQAARLSTDMYRLAYASVGHFRGGLSLATIGACAGFGAMTGSSMATSLTIGHAAYPEMRKYGYSEELSTGSIAAGGTLGAIVPPSGVLVLYAILTEVSIGALFIAAAIPAFIAVLSFVLTVMIQVRLQPAAAPEINIRQSGAVIAAMKGIWPSMGLIVVVLGGIYVGVFTVTEAASVGALGTFTLAWARGGLANGALKKVMIETAERTAMVYALIIGGSIFGFFVGLTELPVEATKILNHFNLPGLAVVAIALVVYILLGMIMGAYEIMIITVPVITPILVGFNFDLVWWGIVMVMVVEIGLLTPPFGMNCFIIKAVATDVPLSKVFKGVTPFICAHIATLALLVLFPPLVLWLPNLLR